MVETVNFELIPESKKDHWFNQYGNKLQAVADSSVYKLHLNIAEQSYHVNQEKITLMLDELGVQGLTSFKMRKLDPKDDPGYQHYQMAKKLILDIRAQDGNDVDALISAAYNTHKQNGLPTKFIDEIDACIQKKLSPEKLNDELDSINKSITKYSNHVERLMGNSQVTLYLPKFINLRQLKQFCLKLEEAFKKAGVQSSNTCAVSDVQVSSLISLRLQGREGTYTSALEEEQVRLLADKASKSDLFLSLQTALLLKRCEEKHHLSNSILVILSHEIELLEMNKSVFTIGYGKKLFAINQLLINLLNSNVPINNEDFQTTKINYNGEELCLEDILPNLKTDRENRNKKLFNETIANLECFFHQAPQFLKDFNLSLSEPFFDENVRLPAGMQKPNAEELAATVFDCYKKIIEKAKLLPGETASFFSNERGQAQIQQDLWQEIQHLKMMMAVAIQKAYYPVQIDLLSIVLDPRNMADFFKIILIKAHSIYVQNELNYDMLNGVRPKLNARVEFHGYTLEPMGGGKHKVPDESVQAGKEKPEDNSPFAKFAIKDFDIQKRSQWKAHISIDPSELSKAWQIIAPLLIYYQIPEFKITRLSIAGLQKDRLIQSEDDIEEMKRMTEGMQISIYPEKGKEKQLNELFYEIEKALKLANIKPGTIHSSDRQIGEYISVRNSSHSNIPGIKVKDYNPDKAEDPFVIIGQNVSHSSPKM